MLLDLIKGFLIGICASAPLGPIAIFVIQKSLSEGHKAGFLTGLGACLVDTVFSIVAIFALAYVQKFLDENTIMILLVGGLVVACMGGAMTFGDPFRKMTPDNSRTYSIRDFLKAVVMGVSNPGAILVIFALFAFFGIEFEHHDFRIAPMILSVSAGAAFYWFLFSGLFSHIRKNFKLNTILWINRIAGIIVLIIGLSLVAEGVIKLIFLK